MTKGETPPQYLRMQIIEYLAKHPNQKIKDIQKGTGNEFHSAISRAIKSLKSEEADLVKETSTDKPERGPRVSQYSLTQSAFYQVLVNYTLTSEEIIQCLTSYSKIYSEINTPLKYFKALETVAPKEGISLGWLRTYALLSKHEYPDGLIEKMCETYAYDRLGAERILPFIKAYQGPDAAEQYKKKLREMGSEAWDKIKKDYEEFNLG